MARSIHSSRELLESPLASPAASPTFAQTLPARGGTTPASTAPATAFSERNGGGFSGGSSLSFTWTPSWGPRPSTVPKTSIQLVEKTKVDIDKFRIWPDHGGRANTPLSYWKEETVPVSNRSTSPSPGLNETDMRSVLAMGDNDQGFGCQAGLRVLDGCWVSNQDGEVRGKVHGEHFYWACDGSSSPLRIFGDRQETLMMCLDGVRHFGVLSADKRRLLWADGDVWLRQPDPREMKAQCQLARKLCWKKWKLRGRYCDGPAWLRPISPNTRRPVQAESPVLPTVPPLRGVIVIRR